MKPQGPHQQNLKEFTQVVASQSEETKTKIMCCLDPCQGATSREYLQMLWLEGFRKGIHLKCTMMKGVATKLGTLFAKSKNLRVSKGQ